MRHYPKLLVEKVDEKVNLVDMWFYPVKDIITVIKITYDSKNTKDINIYEQQGKRPN